MLLPGSMSSSRSYTGMKSSVPESIYRAFEEQREELVWLASFLLTDRRLVDVCLVDAFETCIRCSAAFRRFPKHWARRAIVRSALEMQQYRFATLSPIYQRRGFTRRRLPSLAPDDVRLLIAQSPEAAVRMDVLCRFALALRVLERCSTAESAAMLGISTAALETACCAALQVLDQLAQEFLDGCDTDGEKCDAGEKGACN